VGGDRVQGRGDVVDHDVEEAAGSGRGGAAGHPAAAHLADAVAVAEQVDRALLDRVAMELQRTAMSPGRGRNGCSLPAERRIPVRERVVS
jgi:hypothetical protein